MARDWLRLIDSFKARGRTEVAVEFCYLSKADISEAVQIFLPLYRL